MTKTPLPGRRVRGSRTGRPLMALLDLVGRRHALRILWELRNGPLTFRDTQAAAEVSPSVLNARFAELREARIVELGEEGYQLTDEGAALIEAFMPLAEWSESWGTGMGR